MHRDIVTVAPPGSTIIGSNDNCACQAMIIPDRVLSVQGTLIWSLWLIIGHPEFNRDIVEFLLDNRFAKGLFSRDEYDEAFPHAADEDDGVKIGEGIMNFLSGVTA
jgi:GMP synthase-like glutamine amidotransferase